MHQPLWVWDKRLKQATSPFHTCQIRGENWQLSFMHVQCDSWVTVFLTPWDSTTKELKVSCYTVYVDCPSHKCPNWGRCSHFRSAHKKLFQCIETVSRSNTLHRFPLLDLLAIGSDTGVLFQLMLYSSSLASRSILHSSNNHLLGNVRKDASGSIFIDGKHFNLSTKTLIPGT